MTIIVKDEDLGEFSWTLPEEAANYIESEDKSSVKKGIAKEGEIISHLQVDITDRVRVLLAQLLVWLRLCETKDEGYGSVFLIARGQRETSQWLARKAQE